MINWRNVALLVLIIGLPIVLLLLSRSANTFSTRLPVLGPYELSGEDTLYGQLEIDVDGVKDKHLLLHFAQTGDTNALNTPALLNLKKLAKRLPEAGDIVILSFGSKAPKQSGKYEYWLHKNDSSMANHLSSLVLYTQDSDDLQEDQMIVLVDRNRQIRGFFKGAHDRFMRNILGELVVLRKEFNEGTDNR